MNKVRIPLTLDAHVVNKIDELGKYSGLSRIDVIRKAITEHLKKYTIKKLF